MAETTTIARPYARAAFDVASAASAVPAWSEALAVAAAATGEASLQAALDSPRLGAEQKAALVADICDDGTGGALPDGARNFIRVLAENARLVLLPEIAVLFEELRAEAERTIQAEVISAMPLSDEQLNRLAEALKKRLNRDVALTCTVDEALLGGAIVRAGDLVIDGSAKGHLAKLDTALRQ